MKNAKLIPKHLIGKKILNFLEAFGNALIAGDSGVGTSMAVASGYQYNPKNSLWELSEENLKEAEGLRNNLAVLSTFSPTHPATVFIEKAVVPGVRFISNHPIIKQGLKLINTKYLKPNVKPIQKFYTQLVENVKNIYNRYTAPKTNIVMTPYKGDLFLLSKYRLRNGGFDKLGITPDDVMYVPKEHPMYAEPTSKFALGIESPVNARKFLLKSEAIPIKEEIEGVAYYSHSGKQFSQPTKGKWGTIDKKTKAITGHEFYHSVDDVVNSKNVSTIGSYLAKYYPKNGINLNKLTLESNYVNPPGTDFSKIPSKISRYFRDNKGTELHARFSLLKNWFGITDPHQPITPDMWNYARRHYVNSIGADNNMLQLFRAVTDPKKFLDWINPRVATLVTPTTIGGSTLLNYNNNE